MDLRGDVFSELNLPESESRQCILVYAKIIALPLLVYLVFLLGYFGKIDFKVETHSIVLMGIIFLISLVFARHSAEFGCCVFEQGKNEFKASLKRYIIKHLLPIGREVKSNASFREFVADYAKDMRNDNYASVAAGIFPTLGILGTFISIAYSMPSFSASSTDALEQEISVLLSGVGTAFYVSIYGIFLALWWIFFEKRGMSRFEKLINRQKNATETFFWTKEEIEQEFMQENLRHFEKIGTIFEQVSAGDFFDKLGQSVEKKFGLFNEMIRVEEEAIRVSSQHIKDTMSNLAKSQKEQRDLGKLHGEILNALHSFNLGLKEMQIKFSEQYTRLHEISDEKTLRLERCIGELNADTTLFAQSLERFSKKMTEQQEKILDGFRVGMIEGLDSFRNILESESEQQNETDLALEDLKDSLAEVNEEASAIISRLDELK